MNEHEEKTISAFIVKEKQDRYRFLLGNANPQRRRQGTDRLNHCFDLNEMYATWLPSNTNIVRLLRDEGSPQGVYVISDRQELDGKMMPLEAAVDEMLMGGWGSIISCLPGQLAFYYGEGGESRALLKRKLGT